MAETQWSRTQYLFVYWENIPFSYLSWGKVRVSLAAKSIHCKLVKTIETMKGACNIGETSKFRNDNGSMKFNLITIHSIETRGETHILRSREHTFIHSIDWNLSWHYSHDQLPECARSIGSFFIALQNHSLNEQTIHCISVTIFFIRDYGNESMNIDDAYNNNNPKQIQTNP